MSLFEELKRRNVFRVGVAYIVASWVLLQVADLVLDAINAPDWVIQAMLMFVVLGFIVAMIVAWAYEITPEGIKKESEVERDESITNETAARLDKITIGLLVAVVGIIVVERFVLKPNQGEAPPPVQVATEAATEAAEPESQVSSAKQNSIAVLPFVAMSSGEDDEYFADGLTEEILNSLAQLPELLITARTSAFSFKGQDIPVTEIAEKLGVAHIVEGSVRRSGDRLRVTAQLVRALDGFHLWSQNYDSTSSDTIQVQEDIAEKIAVAMNVVMDEGKRDAMREAGLRDVEAFIAMQKARELYTTAHDVSDGIPVLQEANKYFEQVLERVPGYPPALEEHSDLFVHILNNHVTGIPMAGIGEDEVEHARKQMLVDLNQALDNARNFSERNEYEINLSMLSNNFRGILPRIKRYTEDSGCFEPTWSPQFAVPFGYAAAYAERVSQVTECDPLVSTNWFNEVRALIWAGEPERALSRARQGMEVAPGTWLSLAISWALISSGQFEELNVHINQNMQLEEDRLHAQVNRLAALGESEGVDELFADYMAHPNSTGFAEFLLNARLGNLEEANQFVSSIDEDPWGSAALIGLVLWCLCGAPWDIEVTPNFAADLEEGGMAWPPPSPINWPLKDW